MKLFRLMTQLPFCCQFLLVACLSCLIPLKLYAESKDVIHFGVLSLAPPSKIYTKWKPFAKYLAQETGKSVKIVAPRGFGKLKKMAQEKKVDVYYVNSHIFYQLKQSGKSVAIAQMKNIADSTTSTSDIFVRSDSNINDVAQLKGKTIAFVSPMGAGGYLAPRAYFYEHGVETKAETKELFTKNLTNSIYDVLLGKADAATMCGVNYQLMSKKVDTGELKIIASTTQYPENVIAARSDFSPQVINELTRIITSMPDTPRGQEVLKGMESMKIKAFIPYDPAMEDLTRNLLASGKFGS